jgi:hypothetical protein
MEQSPIYQRFRDATIALGHDAHDIERMSPELVRLLADIEPGRHTATFIANMKRKLARDLRTRARQATLAWIAEFVRQRFAAATVRMPEDKTVVIYLDGMAGEVD